MSGSIKLISNQLSSSHSLMKLDLMFTKLGRSLEKFRTTMCANMGTCPLSKSCLERQIACFPSFWNEQTSIEWIGGGHLIYGFAKEAWEGAEELSSFPREERP